MGKLKPITPGDLLRKEFLGPLAISQYRLAKEIGVPAQRIGDILSGKRAVTADTDLRLCRFFGLTNGYWLRTQAAHDTEVAKRALGATLGKIKPFSTDGAYGLRDEREGKLRRFKTVRDAIAHLRRV